MLDRAKQDELLAAYDRIDELETIIEQCRIYFDNKSDVIDGDYGNPAPNKEMRMLQEIDEVMS